MCQGVVTDSMVGDDIACDTVTRHIKVTQKKKRFRNMEFV